MAVAMAVVADLFHQEVLIDAVVAVVAVDLVDMHPKLAVNSLVAVEAMAVVASVVVALVLVVVEARPADLLPLLVAIIILPAEPTMVLLPLLSPMSFLSQLWVHPHLHLHHLLDSPHPLHPFMFLLQASLLLA